LAQNPRQDRFRLGRALKAARNAAGRTQDETAARLGCGQGKVSKIEGSTVNVSEDDLCELLDLYRVSDTEATALRELHRGATVPRTTPGGRPRPAAFNELVAVECDASEILSWHSERIPGPLQHTRYMLKQYELDRPGKRSAVRTAVAERVSRLGIFTVSNPPRYRVILSESSLRRLPGGWTPDLELDQIRNLETLSSDYPQFELRILPFTANIAHADTDFAVLRFAPGAPVTHYNFVYLEHIADAEIVKDVDPFTEYWDVLSAAALTRDETVAFMARRARTLEESKAC
jgi:transcriptional regulator with XRE-family HTH domain